MSLITVVGSVNRDFVLTVKNLPHPGETVLARHFVEGVGGKGANQDVAAARLGSRVRLVARVGADASVDALASEGVDVGAVRSNGLAATGIATAVVDDSRREHHRRQPRQPAPTSASRTCRPDSSGHRERTSWSSTRSQPTWSSGRSCAPTSREGSLS